MADHKIEPTQIFHTSKGVIAHVERGLSIQKDDRVLIEKYKRRTWFIVKEIQPEIGKIILILKMERLRRQDAPKESNEQIRFVSLFKAAFPDAWIFKVTNEGDRKNGAKLVREGLEKGVPDLEVPKWDLYIEMKRQKGGASRPDQEKWAEYLTSIGKTVLRPEGHLQAFEQVFDFLAIKRPQDWGYFKLSAEYEILKKELEKDWNGK